MVETVPMSDYMRVLNALAAEQAYHNNNTGENALWRRTALSALTGQEVKTLKKMKKIQQEKRIP